MLKLGLLAACLLLGAASVVCIRRVRRLLKEEAEGKDIRAGFSRLLKVTSTLAALAVAAGAALVVLLTAR